ncbi:MAG: excinuclease ABC subunit UvrC [bacterium]|nr:excinuclease ABC subunit UvrC [bacterium]
MSILKEKLKNLPDQPGVYQFYDARGGLLYIGKAKALKKRVNSYFSKKDHDNKTSELVKKIKDMEITTTKNELEALLLEASLIRKNQPPFNIDLKSGSGRYAYLKITNEKFPRIITVRKENEKSDGKIFGPYASGQTRREAQYWANAILKLRTCKTLPKQACLLYHINLCSAPCVKKISETEYNENVKKAEKFLKGDISALKEEMALEMKEFAKSLKYEQAKLRRDQILAIARIEERQNIDLPKGYDQDVFNFKITKDELIVQLFNINKGLISGKKEFNLKNTDISEFVIRYYDHHEIPEEIVLPRKLKDQAIIKKYLENRSSHKVKFTIPEKGSKKDLLKLLEQNLEISAKVGNAVLYDLQQALNLPRLPKTIEMFDISHTGGTEIVASLVSFSDGRPDKSNYRKFIMKTVKDNDDFAAMREVVERRYKFLIKETKPLPDLIIVDGGRGQLSSALSVLQELGITTPLIALAKKEEEVYTVGRRFPVRLAKTNESLKLLQRIRDEAHRFAITFHRQRRSKKLLLNK